MALANPRVFDRLISTGNRHVRQARDYGINYLGNMARRTIRRGIRSRLRSARQWTNRTRTRKRKRGGQGVTEQYDRRTIYRKKSMGRFKKRRWKRFKNKVNAVFDKNLGSKTVVFNSQISSGFIVPQFNSQQGRQQLALYPAKNPAGLTHLGDVQAVLQNDPSIPATGKIAFTSGILDLTFNNTSSPAEGQPNVNLEVDVYEMQASKQFGRSGSTPLSLDFILDESLSDADDINGAGTKLTMATRGVTPWDSTQALSQFGIRILKKTKYIINQNQTFTYQFRDPTRHVFDKEQLDELNSSNLRRATKWIYVIFKPVAGTVGIGPPDAFAELSVGVTRKYMYHVVEQNGDGNNAL